MGKWKKMEHQWMSWWCSLEQKEYEESPIRSPDGIDGVSNQSNQSNQIKQIKSTARCQGWSSNRYGYRLESRIPPNGRKRNQSEKRITIQNIRKAFSIIDENDVDAHQMWTHIRCGRTSILYGNKYLRYNMRTRAIIRVATLTPWPGISHMRRRGRTHGGIIRSQYKLQDLGYVAERKN